MEDRLDRHWKRRPEIKPIDLPDLISKKVLHLSPKLHCLVVCLSRSWGGLEQVAATDSTDLADLGLKIRVICLEGSPIADFLLRHSGISLLPISRMPRNNFDFAFRSQIDDLLEEGVNLIHVHQPSLLGSIVPWIWFEPKVGLIATRHIMSNHMKRDPYHRLLYSRVDFLTVMSQVLRRNVIETHHFRENDIQVVNLGLDFDAFEPSRVQSEAQRKEWGADPDTIVIGLVGRIDPAKGQAVFIQAAAGLMTGLPVGRKIKFVIVGEETLGGSSNHLAELKQMVADYRLEDVVLFAGYHKNIPEVMKSFDIFVMPSRQEAFGLVAIEAMAMERPIVVSRGGSAGEIVGFSEEYGLMVRPGDPYDLQVKLRSLMDHPKERALLGARAREHVYRNYDRKKRVLKTLQLYERVLKKRAILL